MMTTTTTIFTYHHPDRGKVVCGIYLFFLCFRDPYFVTIFIRLTVAIIVFIITDFGSTRMNVFIHVIAVSVASCVTITVQIKTRTTTTTGGVQVPSLCRTTDIASMIRCCCYCVGVVGIIIIVIVVVVVVVCHDDG